LTSSWGRLEVIVMFQVVDGVVEPPPLAGGGCCCGAVGDSAVQPASASTTAAAASERNLDRRYVLMLALSSLTGRTRP
jgi:hypothetical protein